MRFRRPDEREKSVPVRRIQAEPRLTPAGAGLQILSAFH
jgi:hypothetical protein